MFAAAPALWAQPVLRLEEDLDFDRPEAWALKYFSAVTQLTGLGVPERLPAGAWVIGLEGGSLPHLSARERTVGFYGTKTEDLNKTPAFGRPRVTVGLPAALSLTLAYAPPLEIGGARPSLLSLALARPLYEAESWRLGARLYGQIGKVKGDFTCPEDEARAGRDPVANPYLCERKSRDEATLRYWGFELGAAWTLGKAEPYFAAAINRLDPEFQVNAQYNGLLDRTHQTTQGNTWSIQAGVGYQAREKLQLTAELFYAPLTLVRTQGGTKEHQDLLNLRLMAAYRVR
ncbi:MAG: hypothetical protein U0002_01665 [Thermoanaerobaculia bacterium]